MILPPGFRFHPTDEELVTYYLHRKINGGTIELEIIPEIDLYKCEPWDLPDKSFLPGKDMEWYFFSPRDRKYPNGSRTNRSTGSGYWKATGKDRLVQSQKRPVGMKKTLVYYRGRAPHGTRTDWVMHEYRLVESASGSTGPDLKDSYAICRVMKKNIVIPQTKHRSPGGSLNQMSWDDNGTTPVTSRDQKENIENENIAKNSEFSSKLQSAASSSDLTQWTPVAAVSKDHSMAQIISDEVNNSFDCFGSDRVSDFIQDARIANYTSSFYETCSYSPLYFEDFLQGEFMEAESIISEYMNCDRFRDCLNGVTMFDHQELCSSQENLSYELKYGGSSN